MKYYNISFNIAIDDNVSEADIDKIRSQIDHHIDYFVDLDGYPEIRSIFDAKMKPLYNKTGEKQ